MKARNGIWQSDFYLTNGERVRTSLGTRDKAVAVVKERELQVTMEAALQGRPFITQQSPSKAPVTAYSRRKEVAEGHLSGMTLKEAYKRCMREHEPWRASTSKTTIEANYQHVANELKEDTDLALIDRERMLDFVDKLRDEKGLSPSTINQRLSLVSVLLTYAERWTYGKVHPFKMPRQKARQGRIRVLSYDEEFAVVRWFKESKRARGHDKDMAALVAFLVETGFRLGEALRLTTEDIDWDNGMVPAWETKADHPRQVPMTARVRDILEARSHLYAPFGMFSVDSADDHWERMRNDLGISRERDPEFVIHALRHTCASRLVASGMDAFRVQKWMGHKNITTTQKYVTLFGSDLHDLAKALDQRRSKAALQVPFFGNKVVPKNVPKMRHPETIKVGHGIHGLPKRPAPQGIRPMHRTDAPVDEGLLIRRSLVRAQVEEPSSIKKPSHLAGLFVFPGSCSKPANIPEKQAIKRRQARILAYSFAPVGALQ